MFTRHDVPDRFDQSGEGRDVGLPVLPHGLPDHQAAGQPEGQVRLLDKQRLDSGETPAPVPVPGVKWNAP